MGIPNLLNEKQSGGIGFDLVDHDLVPKAFSRSVALVQQVFRNSSRAM